MGKVKVKLDLIRRIPLQACKNTLYEHALKA